MNRFSSSSETLSDSVVDSPEDPTMEPSEWELKMSRLMGLSIEESIDDANNSIIEQSDDLSTTGSPQESRTEQPISANPLAKLGLVAAVTLGIVVLAGVFLSQIINSGPKSSNKDRSLVSKQVPLVKSESQELSREVETLKTKLALSEQVEAMKAAQETLRRSPVESVSGIKTSIAPPKVKIVYVPKIVTVDRIVKIPQLIENNSQPALISRAIPKPIPAKSPKSQNSNPQVSKNQSVVATAVVTQPATTPTLDRSLLKHIANTISDPSPSTKAETKSPIASGSTVRGVLATSVFGETTISTNNNPTEKEKNIFVVRLLQPLKSIDGEVVFPENTELLTEINSLSEQGLLNLKVLKAVKKNNGTLTEINLPKNAMSISSVEGKPLIATQHPNQSSSIAGLDIGLFLLGGLGKIAELTNRTESQVVTTSAAGSIITNANPKSNVIAGFIEGGSNSVVPQIAQRNQQAIATMMQRTNIWFLPAETEVEVHVNQLLQF